MYILLLIHCSVVFKFFLSSNLLKSYLSHICPESEDNKAADMLISLLIQGEVTNPEQWTKYVTSISYACAQSLTKYPENIITPTDMGTSAASNICFYFGI